MISTIVLGTGCFWCSDSIFRSLKGVITVETGYANGHIDNPTYKQVCSGNTGHVEVVRITFRTEVISLIDLLNVFWYSHDPTSKDKQGCDVGPQYRSVILFTNHEQKQIAQESMLEMQEGPWRGRPIVTEVQPLSCFFNAEDYHQNYCAKNPSVPFCLSQIFPKVTKMRSKFPDLFI
ncbi:hypothetical protein P9112_009197 [Eukaryota sp. TZLM1-RC]